MKDDHRVIIVMGMARSGTTVFTHVLSQHPKIFLFHNVYNYENDLLFNLKSEEIQKIILEHPSKFILFKRPWIERIPLFFKEHLPNAYYIYLSKPFSMIQESWSKTSWVDKELRDANLEDKKKFYDEHIQIAKNFPKIVGTNNFKMIDYISFIENPQKIMEEVSRFLKLKNYKEVNKQFIPIFDTSMVKKGGSWSFLKKN